MLFLVPTLTGFRILGFPLAAALRRSGGFITPVGGTPDPFTSQPNGIASVSHKTKTNKSGMRSTVIGPRMHSPSFFQTVYFYSFLMLGLNNFEFHVLRAFPVVLSQLINYSKSFDFKHLRHTRVYPQPASFPADFK